MFFRREFLENKRVKSVAVFCGSKDGLNPQFKKMARELGFGLSLNKIKLVYGGGSVGLMGEVANAVQEKKGEILGVIPKHLIELEVGKTDLENLEITENMHDRKIRMYSKADAIIILPGGLGTLDEFFEILTWAQLGLHQKRIILLNPDNFWDPLLALLRHQHQNGFVEATYKQLFSEFKTVENILAYLKSL